MIADGKKNLLLNSPINLTCPVRLLQGMKDDEVPYATAEKIAEAITGADVEIHLVKDGDHRLSTPANLELLKNTLLDIIRL